VKSNQSNGNTGDGIHADAGAANNTFSGNTMNGNGGFDAHDESNGARTAGTANTWASNNCVTDSPDGLCP
jgi:parallel beta-helix repeat protein